MRFITLALQLTAACAWKLLQPVPMTQAEWDAWTPVPSNNTWRAANQTIFYKNKPFVVKGSSLNGFESGAQMILGLWNHPLSFYLDFLKTHAFNVIRIPLPYEAMIDLSRPIGDVVQADPLFHANMPFKEAMRIVLDEIYKRDMFALPDMHTVHGYISEYPWDREVSGDQRAGAWINFMEEFWSHPALMGIELLNEAHGLCSLHELESWEAVVIHNVLQQFPEYQGLFFLGGTSYKGSAAWGGSYQNDNDARKGSMRGSFNATWEGTFQDNDNEMTRYLMTFQGLDHPSALCAIGTIDRYVLSPHVYGYSVRGSGVANEHEDTWEMCYGFIRNLPNHWKEAPIVPTEIGDSNMAQGSVNRAWYDGWAKYHTTKKNITNGAVWWTAGPFSGDTGGLLDENGNADLGKLDFMDKLTNM